MEAERESETHTQKIQNKVDNLKLLNLTNNIHRLTPPSQTEDDGQRDIALVKSLSVTPKVAQLFLEIRGLEFDPTTKKYIQVTDPIMNILGAYRFCKLLKNLTEQVEWASYSEDEIKPRIIHFFEENIPYFLFWAEDYNLNPRDFNYIITTLQAYVDSTFHKAKSGKYINTLGRTYDEGLLKRALDNDNPRQQKREGFLERMNPFKDK